MDEQSVCAPQLVESDAQSITRSAPLAASATDADKVINTKTDSTQVEGVQSEEELLKGLLTDHYCHVCEAVLLFKSQRLSHYEGKKHAQKLKVYLQAKRAEKMNKESTGPQRTMTTDKDRFCELCNMVFSSPVVAKSHYQGKVHIKNLRKQGLQTPDRLTEVSLLPCLPQDAADEDHRPAPVDIVEHPVDPTTTLTSTTVDLKDPNKYCSLCAASFNNPQMALQHYNGRKHQRNAARQELLKELGDDADQANHLMCQMCSVQFNSVEMYQAHMQGTKHQIREKKVIDLCKSQQRSYSTFADELADYIQVQKARGLAPKTGPALSSADGQQEEEEEEDNEDLNIGRITQLTNSMPKFPVCNPPHQAPLGFYYPVEGCHPSYQGPPWPPYSRPPSALPGSASLQFTVKPVKRKRQRTRSSSSSYTASSSYSSSFSSTSSSSDSDSSGYRRRERRRTRKSRSDRSRRARDADSDMEGRGRKRRRKVRDDDSEERRREEYGESEEERRRQRRRRGKQRREKKSQEEDFEVEGERCKDSLQPNDTTETAILVQPEQQQEERQDEPAKPKNRREKKKTREEVDTRTEEEKLWDDSILGC
ncbi:zinc finger matrin-type protein 1 [Aulostomus maculatus]